MHVSEDRNAILHVLEHIRPLDQAIGEIWRIMKPSAWLYVEVPCTHSGTTVTAMVST